MLFAAVGLRIWIQKSLDTNKKMDYFVFFSVKKIFQNFFPLISENDVPRANAAVHPCLWDLDPEEVTCAGLQG